MNSSVTFVAQEAMFQPFTVLIGDDNVALENLEVFEIEFTGSSPSDGPILGSNTEVTISDTDCKQLEMLTGHLRCNQFCSLCL